MDWPRRRAADTGRSELHAIWRTNELLGRDAIHFLATGTTCRWQMQQTTRSPRYMTRWSELAKPK